MTTRSLHLAPNGDQIEVLTAPGAAPLVFVNGVLQHISMNEKYLRAVKKNWKQWFAWRPVKDIHGQWHWLKEIYRASDKDNRYHYGTIFDVIADE